MFRAAFIAEKRAMRARAWELCSVYNEQGPVECIKITSFVVNATAQGGGGEIEIKLPLSSTKVPVARGIEGRTERD